MKVASVYCLNYRTAWPNMLLCWVDRSRIEEQVAIYVRSDLGYETKHGLVL
jgi:hypothetical protein